MTLDELEKLAKAVDCGGPWLQVVSDERYLDACSPERILAMIECIRAADEMRRAGTATLAERDCAFDAARAKLDEAMK